EAVRDLLHVSGPVALTERDVGRFRLPGVDAADAPASHPEQEHEGQRHLHEQRRKNGGNRHVALRQASDATRTTVLPKFSPRKRPIRPRGAFSSPSTTYSRCLILPSRTHAVISRRKSGSSAAKSDTM